MKEAVKLMKLTFQSPGRTDNRGKYNKVFGNKIYDIITSAAGLILTKKLSYYIIESEMVPLLTKIVIIIYCILKYNINTNFLSKISS